MKNYITDTELDDITHSLVTALAKVNIHLSGESLAKANDTISSFLIENCAITLVNDDAN